MKILLLSAYDARSHQLWREGLCTHFPEHQWTTLTLPARHFAWRARSNAMQWFVQNDTQLNTSFDLLIATSMVDLVSLRGLIPALATVPSILYFHENQFAYPKGSSDHSTIELQLTSIYGALAASALVFNSKYNRDTFLSGVRGLMARVPDRLGEDLEKAIVPKCQVLPVPLNDSVECGDSVKHTPDDAVQIVWNHRWEYDKGPDRLLAFCVALLEADQPFLLHVVGQQFRKQPSAFTELKALLEQKRPKSIGCWGFVSSADSYQSLLRQSHIALSTAEHDFQGLAVLEAIQAGCVPLVPNRLAYPEWIGAEYRYQSHTSSKPTPLALQFEAKQAVTRLSELMRTGLGPPDISKLGWRRLRADYEKLILQFGAQ